MAKFEIRRIERPDDPHRCQGTIKTGQCQNLAYQAPDGSWPTDKCVMHGAHNMALKFHEQSARQYKIEKYQNRIKDFRDNPDIKSLRDEIAILRILVEERMNSIKDEFSMIAAAGPIAELISKIERTVRTCQAIEEKTGITLDRSQVMQIGDQLIGILIDAISSLNLPEDVTSSLLAKVAVDFDMVFKGASNVKESGPVKAIAAENIRESSEEESD